MTKVNTIKSLLALIAGIPAGLRVALWSGIPCTGGSPLQIMNKKKPSYGAKMQAHRKLFNRLYSNMLVVAQAVIRRGGHIVIEWPRRCLYWRHPRVTKLLSTGSLHWTSMHVRACAHGQLITTGKHA